MRKPLDALKRRLRLPSPSMVVAVAAVFIALGGGAYAASQINGQNIQNGTIGQAKFNLLTRQKLNHTVGKNWGIITRNTIGSGVADLRSGPYGSFGVTGSPSRPPYGFGSLGLQVSNNALSGGTPQEKVAFGNEVDFFGHAVADLDRAGFHVFQTGENAAISASNMPNITLEINPDCCSSVYTSMVWVPDPAPVTNRWSGFIDAATTGYWYFTNGGVASATGCGISDSCSLADAKAGLVTAGGTDASIYTVAVGKGRDNAWVGAVDGLRINDDIYDFDVTGVQTISSP
jgi:hypothetical protein